MAIPNEVFDHGLDALPGSYADLVRRRDRLQPDPADGCFDTASDHNRDLCPPIAHAIGDATGAPVRVRVSARRRKPAWRA